MTIRENPFALLGLIPTIVGIIGYLVLYFLNPFGTDLLNNATCSILIVLLLSSGLFMFWIARMSIWFSEVDLSLRNYLIFTWYWGIPITTYVLTSFIAYPLISYIDGSPVSNNSYMVPVILESLSQLTRKETLVITEKPYSTYLECVSSILIPLEIIIGLILIITKYPRKRVIIGD